MIGGFATIGKKILKNETEKAVFFLRQWLQRSISQGAHVPPSEISCFINHCLQKRSNHNTIFENLGWAERTGVDWRSFCSEVTVNCLSNLNPIGGENNVVETDESCFGKRKYERGQELSNVWVIGGIERELKRCFLIPPMPSQSPNGNKETLVPLIKNYILLGTTSVRTVGNLSWARQGGLRLPSD